MRICLDPGHGSEDSGAIGGGMLEKDKNLEVGKQAYQMLIEDGYEVRMTRTTDIYLSLGDRCRISNEFKADIFISLHHNAGGGVGFEVIHSLVGGGGEYLAHCLAKEFRDLGIPPHPAGTDGTYSRRGNHGDYYGVIRGTEAVAIIAEGSHIDNAQDIKRMQDPEWPVKYATAIRQAVREYDDGTKDH